LYDLTTSGCFAPEFLEFRPFRTRCVRLYKQPTTAHRLRTEHYPTFLGYPLDSPRNTSITNTRRNTSKSSRSCPTQHDPPQAQFGSGLYPSQHDIALQSAIRPAQISKTDHVDHSYSPLPTERSYQIRSGPILLSLDTVLSMVRLCYFVHTPLSVSCDFALTLGMMARVLRRWIATGGKINLSKKQRHRRRICNRASAWLLSDSQQLLTRSSLLTINTTVPLL
jgi:hypothetical protein